MDLYRHARPHGYSNAIRGHTLLSNDVAVAAVAYRYRTTTTGATGAPRAMAAAAVDENADPVLISQYVVVQWVGPAGRGAAAARRLPREHKQIAGYRLQLATREPHFKSFAPQGSACPVVRSGVDPGRLDLGDNDVVASTHFFTTNLAMVGPVRDRAHVIAIKSVLAPTDGHVLGLLGQDAHPLARLE